MFNNIEEAIAEIYRVADLYNEDRPWIVEAEDKEAREKELAEVEKTLGFKLTDDYSNLLIRYEVFDTLEGNEFSIDTRDLKKIIEDTEFMHKVRADSGAEPLPATYHPLGFLNPDWGYYVQDSKTSEVYSLDLFNKFSKPEKVADNLLGFFAYAIHGFDQYMKDKQKQSGGK